MDRILSPTGGSGLKDITEQEHDEEIERLQS